MPNLDFAEDFLQISGRRAIMANKQHSSKKERSFHTPEKDKNLLTRRNFISAAAGIGAMGVIAKGAKKTKEDESKMPVWTGDLGTLTKLHNSSPTD